VHFLHLGAAFGLLPFWDLERVVAMPRDRHDLEHMFPITDEPSAHLMLRKALCLLQAGAIDTSEAAAVFRKASEAVYRPELV
jgi:hypothetical protein